MTSNGLRYLLGHPTRKGPVFIAQSPSGRFHVVWRGEIIDSAHDVVAAVDNVALGAVPFASDGTDFSTLDISHDIGDWVPADELR